MGYTELACLAAGLALANLFLVYIIHGANKRFG